MNRIALKITMLFVIAVVMPSCSSDSHNRFLATKNKVSAVIAGVDIKNGEEFKKSNLSSKLVDLYSWQISMPSEESLLERRAARDLKRGDPITLEDVMSVDRLKWTRQDEIRNQEIQNTFPGNENFFFPSRDMKKGEPFLTMFVGRLQVPIGGLKPGYAPPGQKTYDYIGPIPADAIRSLSEVHGKKAKNALKARMPIRRIDLEDI